MHSDEANHKLNISTFHAGRGRELLHHGRRAGDEEMAEIRLVSGETNLILYIETYQL